MARGSWPHGHASIARTPSVVCEGWCPFPFLSFPCATVYVLAKKRGFVRCLIHGPPPVQVEAAHARASGGGEPVLLL